MYPDVTLAYAREQLQEARQLLARGIDPSAQRRTVKIARADSFKVIAEEWLEMQAERLAPITMTKARWILGSLVYPRLGSWPIAEITAPEVLAVLRPIESRGMNETAHQALQRCGQIFGYAIATGRATRDITSDLRGALAPVVVENRAAITEPSKIGALLRAIDDYIGHPTTLIALKLSPLVFLRPSELRAAEWSEIDLQTAEWRVPAARMKMRERHIVPLASQAVALLRELRGVTGKGRYLFPSLRSSDRPMSVNTVNGALRRLGYARATSPGARCRLRGPSHPLQGHRPDATGAADRSLDQPPEKGDDTTRLLSNLMTPGVPISLTRSEPCVLSVVYEGCLPTAAARISEEIRSEIHGRAQLGHKIENRPIKGLEEVPRNPPL